MFPRIKRTKVLIIAGGGIFGCIPAHFLGMLPADHQNMYGIDVLSGCSIGGILTAAYAAGKHFGIIDTVFQQKASNCFTERTWAKIDPLALPTYRNDTIDKVLDEMIGDVTLGEVKNIYPNLSIIIPALNVTKDHYIVFDNIRGKRDSKKLADIAGYTSCAPSYYAGRVMDGDCIIDGGLIEVIPLITATTCVKKNLKIPFCRMDVLILGTGHDIDEKPLTPKIYNSLGWYGMAKELLVPYATLANKLATLSWGNDIGYGYFKYFDPLITNGRLDDVSLVPSLVNQTEQYREEFLDTWNEWLNR